MSFAKEQVQHWYVDQRQSLSQIARRLALPIQQIRALAQEERWVWRPLRAFSQLHRGVPVLILDLETSGLPRTQGFNRYFPYTELDAYDTSRIVQLAFCLFRIGEPVSRSAVYSAFRRPEGFTLSADAQVITHLEPEWLEKHGQSIQTVLEPLLSALHDCELILAHNAGFDINILKNELFRLGYNTYQIEEQWFPDRKVRCTCRLTDFTRLQTLHSWVPDASPLQFHNAQDDVLALAEIINFLSIQ